MAEQVQKTVEDDPSDLPEILTKFPGELHVKNVSKSFGVTKALDNVSLLDILVKSMQLLVEMAVGKVH